TGRRATRYSSVLISLGTPTIMRGLRGPYRVRGSRFILGRGGEGIKGNRAGVRRPAGLVARWQLGLIIRCCSRDPVPLLVRSQHETSGVRAGRSRIVTPAGLPSGRG